MPKKHMEEVKHLTVAHFRSETGTDSQMEVYEDRIAALIPEELGIRIPFAFSPQTGEQNLLKWDLSYLYTELWSVQGDGPHLIAPSLPEFATDRSRPNSMRFPLSVQSVLALEELRRGGDITLILRIQATLIGSVPRDRVPDAGRRQTLEAVGLNRDIFGPIRRSDDITIHIDRSVWAEEILPQWDLADLKATAPIRRSPEANNRLDIRALARSLHGTTPGGNFEEILEQCRDPIVGL